MNFIKTIVAITALAVANAPAAGQTRQAQVTLTVPQAMFLTLAAPAAGVEVAANAASEGRLHLRLRRPADGEPVRVSLLARSNTAYRLMAATLPAPVEASALVLHPEGAQPFSGSEHLMSNALNVNFQAESALSARSSAIFQGPRISRRGNETTPGNAIVLTFNLEMPGGRNEAELLLQMTPQP